MLAELAAANAAYAVIKETIANGGDLLAAGKSLFSYFDNKTAIQKRYNEKGRGGDLEEFMALEQLRVQEEELRHYMQYQGRPGLWDAWLDFQAQAKRKREQEAREEELKRLRFKERIEKIAITVMVIVIVVSIGLMTATMVSIWKG